MTTRSLVIAGVLLAFLTSSCVSSDLHPASSSVSPERSGVSARGDDTIGRAFSDGLSDVPVEGEGTIERVLTDDLNPPRHQRFIVQLASGQTLLVTHNIDIAPRVEGVTEGDTVQFKGEYVWNEKGGVIHWTHHDTAGRHDAGWVKHNGKIYQ